MLQTMQYSIFVAHFEKKNIYVVRCAVSKKPFSPFSLAAATAAAAVSAASETVGEKIKKFSFGAFHNALLRSVSDRLTFDPLSRL